MTASFRAAVAIGLMLAAGATASCSSQTPPPPADQDATLGAMTPAVSVKELMHSLIDPGSDYIFNAVGIFTCEKLWFDDDVDSERKPCVTHL